MVRILLVDDHALIRQGIENLLRSIPDFKIIGSVCSGEEAINFCNEQLPDVILMDIMMKGMTGIEATKWIKDKQPKVKVILLSAEATEELVKNSMSFKANGYILKNEEKEVMIEAIRTVVTDKPYFSKEITDIIFHSYFKEQQAPPTRPKNSSLTKRELEILELLASGCSNPIIADKLFISIKTVESHKANILGKLNLKNTAELVLYAVKQGIVQP